MRTHQWTPHRSITDFSREVSGAFLPSPMLAQSIQRIHSMVFVPAPSTDTKAPRYFYSCMAPALHLQHTALHEAQGSTFENLGIKSVARLTVGGCTNLFPLLLSADHERGACLCRSDCV